jgi:serine/threonine protein kinase/alpha-tubulin suppressor-like RCC1 family protein
MSGERSPAALPLLEREYEILRELGRGGTAIVYLARERATGDEVAIKLIRAKFIEDDEALARLAREARFVEQLDHPNVVPVRAVLDLGDAGIALVMDAVQGRTLKQLIKEEHPLSPERVERLFRDVAAALGAAHALGIVHRDVKPENIFVEPDGRALLADFGVARSMSGDSQLTLSGVAIGTPAYMAPEQIDGTDLDGRGDIYSLGLVGWEMFTGHRPWEGESLYAVLYHQRHHHLPDVREMRADVPDRIADVIAVCIEKEPGARWQNVEELLSVLDSDDPAPRPSSFVPVTSETVRFVRPLTAPPPSPAGPVAPTTSVAVTPIATWLESPDAPRPAFVPPWDPSELDEVPAQEPVVGRRRLALAAGALGLLLSAGLLAAVVERREDEPLVEYGPPLTQTASSGDVVRSATPVPVIATPIDSVLRGAGPSSTRPATPAQTVLVRTDSAPAATATASASGMPSALSVESAIARALPRAPAGASQANTSPVTPLDARVGVTLGGATPAARPVTRTSPAAATGTIARPAAAPPARPQPAPVESTPESDVPVRASRVSIVAGGVHTCLVNAQERAFCWGGNARGQLGTGATARVGAPTAVGGDLRLTSLAPGLSHSCAIARGGAAWCWGENDRGQLGDRSTTSRAAPVRVAGGQTFRAIASGAAHSCALDLSGQAWCWGANGDGQLGDGGTSDRASPGSVTGSMQFSSIDVGWNFSCALRAGRAMCWGDNSSGQLGDGTTTDRYSPVPVQGDVPFTSVTAGSAHACGLTAKGEAYCWGRNAAGELGDGTTSARTTPVRVRVSERLVGIVAGAVHTCAVDAEGEAWCWGRNTYGQLGNGGTSDRAQPTRVAGGHTFASVRAFGSHTCGATVAGEAFCWGYNLDGQLGDGSRTHRTRPVYVERPGG